MTRGFFRTVFLDPALTASAPNVGADPISVDTVFSVKCPRKEFEKFGAAPRERIIQNGIYAA
jgi:hypothetical protein